LREIHFCFVSNFPLDLDKITKVLYPEYPPDSNTVIHQKIVVEPLRNFLEETYEDMLDVDKIINMMRDPKKGVQIKNRRYFLKTYENCFIGKELVSWIVKNISRIKSREDAVSLGEELMEEGYFDHVVKEQPFKDSEFYYRFRIDETKSQTQSSFFSPNTKNSSWLDTKKMAMQKLSQDFLTLQSYNVKRISAFMLIGEVEVINNFVQFSS
jgi:hypothetical protein